MTRSRWLVAALPVLLCVGVYAALRTMVAHGASMDEAYRVEGLLARAAAALGHAAQPRRIRAAHFAPIT